MRNVQWAQLLSLTCVAVCAAPGITAQNSNHKNTNSGPAYTRPQQSQAPRQAPATTAQRAPQAATQRIPPPRAQAQPASNAQLPSQTYLQNHLPPVGQLKGPQQTGSTQPAQAPLPGMYQYNPNNSGRLPRQPNSNGSNTPSTNATPPNGSPSGAVVGSNSSLNGSQGSSTYPYGTYTPPQSSTSNNNGQKPPVTNPNGSRTGPNPKGPPQKPPPSQPPIPGHGQGRGPHYPPPNPQWPYPQPQQPPSYGFVPPQRHQPPPQFTSPPPVAPSLSATQPAPSDQQPQPQTPPQSPSTSPASPASSVPASAGTASSTQPSQHTQAPSTRNATSTPTEPHRDISPTLPPSNAVLTLQASTGSPAVGRKVVVEPLLTPSQPGTSYQLNWGDGSAIETVTGASSHHYAKKKLYKVSASTVVADRTLHQEILLKVGPVMWPRITMLLAALSGLGFWALHPVLKVTASYRWGAPGLPEMRLLSRKPYVSLSFVPGQGPSEERITFLKK